MINKFDYRYIRHHGPEITEVDLKVMNSPIYQCLTNDVSNKANIRMLQITPFGLKCLAKEGPQIQDPFPEVKISHARIQDSRSC